MSVFDSDQYPGKPKILFVGSPYSSHVHGWINLLIGGEFNVRLFACTDGCPPADWRVKTYIIANSVPEGLDPEWRESWWPEPERWKAYNEEVKQAVEEEQKRQAIIALHNERALEVEKKRQEKQQEQFEYQIYHPLRYLIAYYFGKRKPTGSPYLPELPNLPPIPVSPFSSLIEPKSKAPSPQEWLADVIRSWKPDIIHTIGLDQGTSFYAQVRKKFHLEGYGKWIIKIFGGSDLAFKIFDPQSLQDVAGVFAEATHVILDNRYYANILITKQVLNTEKICSLTPVPGSGGIDVNELASKWSNPPSARRVIVWPKSYETIWSKAVPVLFALRNVWNRIQPCEVYMLATNSEVKLWLSTLPTDMQRKIHVFEGIPRKAVLDILVKSRVLIAPSLIDGVPNSLYEAMASGALPIVSPLPTITDVVGKTNVIFANNLDQSELEKAIVQAMTDNNLVDEYAERNLKLVKDLADINTIRQKAIDYYTSLAQ